MGTTARGFPYPESSDKVSDGHQAIEDLAEAIDDEFDDLSGIYVQSADIRHIVVMEDSAYNALDPPDPETFYITTDVVGLYIGDVPLLVTGDAGWDITSASFVSSFSVADKDAQPFGVTFAPNGTKMFVIGINSDSVHRYDLSTPWDVTSSSFVSSFSVADKETNPYGVTLSPDGTKMFITGVDSDSVHSYDLSTPWDITSSSFVSSFSVADKETNPRGVIFSPDGTKMFIIGNDSDSVLQYDLSTPRDITSASFVSSFSVADKETTPHGVTFAPDGTKMFVIGSSSNSVHRYDLLTPWYVTSAWFVSSFSVADKEAQPRDVTLSPDGTKMFIVGSSSDSVHRYDL